MEKFSKVKEVIAAIEADAEKFYNGGNAAAGTRVRKAMQDLKGLAQEIRTEVTEKKTALNKLLSLIITKKDLATAGSFCIIKYRIVILNSTG